jgi:hypothetical protein
VVGWPEVRRHSPIFTNLNRLKDKGFACAFTEEPFPFGNLRFSFDQIFA